MWTEMDSPVGTLRIVSDGTAVTAVEFAGPGPEEAPLYSSRTRAAQAAAGRPVGDRDDETPVLAAARDQLAAYFGRELNEFDLPLAPAGTDFQQAVWRQLRGIGYGETVSYGEIAGRLGMTTAASRAVGLANGKNPIPIVVPCHRVVGADGTLTGYAGGLERKKKLLDLEQDALF